MARKSVLNEINKCMVSVIINEHHIGDLTSLHYKKNIRAFLRGEQDEIENFTGLFSFSSSFFLRFAARQYFGLQY